MRLFVDLVVLFLLALIKIGDGVLFIFALIGQGLHLLLSLPQSLLDKTLKKTKRVKQIEIFNARRLKKSKGFFFQNIDGQITRLFQSLKSKTAQKGPLEQAQRKKIRKIIVYHFPFFTKFKYFFLGTFFSFVFIFVPLLFYVFLQDLPNPHQLTFQQIPQTTKIYDRSGNLLYQIYATQNRTIVSLSDVPIYLQQATIATEDKGFYTHPGFDIFAIIRSALANASGEELQGGSTITQQLMKSALLTPETSFSRKIKEVILAFWAERIYTKPQILELYFNQVPYGGTAWGVGAASEVYFGKSVKDLDLAQSAFLAGIPRAPTIYSPYGQTPNSWKKRQKEVLEHMVSLGYISQNQADDALKEDLEFRSPQTPLHAPHFVMYIKDLLVKKYGLEIVERGGLTVVTSLDLKLNDVVQKIVADEVAQNTSLNLTNGAALVTHPSNGDILAMIGSRDFSDPMGGNVNLTTSLRQPGSSIKVVTYSAALSQGFTPATIIDDSPVTYSSPGGPSYSPVNYDGKFHGRVSLRIALANSLNVPAVKTLNQISIPTFITLGKRMGIKTWSDPKQYGLSITLGAAEVTMTDLSTVYGVLANGGEKVELSPILKVTDSKGNVLEEKVSKNPEPVLNPAVAFLMSHILSDGNARAMEFGTNSPLSIPGKTVSVKTGTSDNKRDNWTIGYTKDYLVAVWVGNNDNSPMSQALASGITGAAPIWNKVMSLLLANMPDQKLTPSSNVVQKSCLGRMEYFLKGTENSVNCIPITSPPASPTLNVPSG